MTLPGCVERVYTRFAGYPLPSQLWVCPQCEPDLSADQLRSIPLRELTFAHLTAVHVMSLDDDALRHFFPRLIELLLTTPRPVFDFRVSELKDRLPAWRQDETAAVRELAEAVWDEAVNHHPAPLGYFSDCPSAIDLLDWCDLPVTTFLDRLVSTASSAAALQLADLVDAAFTETRPFETASKTMVLDWIADPSVGDRLQQAFFASDSDAAGRRLSSAYELWAVCARR